MPEDEYAPEAKTIVVQCENIKSISDMHNLVYNEFVRWFDVDLVGDKEKYHSIAIEIFNLIKSPQI